MKTRRDTLMREQLSAMIAVLLRSEPEFHMTQPPNITGAYAGWRWQFCCAVNGTSPAWLSSWSLGQSRNENDPHAIS